MKVSVKLLTSARKSKNGFPVIVEATHRGKIKRYTFKLFAKTSHWDNLQRMPNVHHPDFDMIYPEVADLHAKVKKLNYNNITDFNKIAETLKGSYSVNQNFYSFAAKYSNEKIQQNKRSTALAYDTAVKMLKQYAVNLTFDDIDYNTLNGFKNFKLNQGVKNSTIHTYLRKIRAIYNEAVNRNICKDKQPFKAVFKGLKVRSHRTKKKYISIESIKKLENEPLTGTKDLVRDLFLLQFYFGGQDLIDVYYLKQNNVNNKRVFFERAKIGDRGYEFDLSINDKAQKIINKYNAAPYLFPGRKDYDGYRTFRNRYARYLIKIQTLLGIEVQPKGGNLGIKVARHSFAMRGKLLFIDPDLLRELMGHERDDVDNYYKDRYPETVRDKAQMQIITS